MSFKEHAMTAPDLALSSEFAALVSAASVEISSGGDQIHQLQDHFDRGTDVTITFLPGDNYRRNVETAAALRRAGYNPVPHVAAREMPSRAALDDFLKRARGEADVRRILVIAGDVTVVKGPYKSSGDVCQSGLIEACGITSVSIAGHPEGHPFLTPPNALKVLGSWRDWGRRTEVRVEIITQFCFESAPILQWIGDLEASGEGLPVVIGLAGPATPATLLKFALRCGIGNSIRSLRSQIGRYGRLLTDSSPDEVVRGLQSASGKTKASIAGFHLFPFGGLRKAGDWRRSLGQQAPPPRERVAAPIEEVQKP
jgi:methylenetetrahydrofolate reductase (NADPH)